MRKKAIIAFLSLYIGITILGFEARAENIQLTVSAKSFVLIDLISGRILLEKNSEEKRAMASTTKIMTAIIALEKGYIKSRVKE